jgi:MFS family permease
MLQEIFGGRLLGASGALATLSPDERMRVAGIGASFAALLSLFNIGGRLGWASLSDWLGRKRTYLVFFVVGAALYAVAPIAGAAATPIPFVAVLCAIVTMYGGGFATIPAYLADLFGTQHVGAIHGRLLTAWSVAGIVGPVVVNYLRELQLERGVPAQAAYDTTMYVLAGLLVVGLFATLAVRQVSPVLYMSEAELEGERARAA